LKTSLRNKGAARAIMLLDEIGMKSVIDLPMSLLVSGLGATYIEEPMSNSDGIIVRGNTKTLIKVNSLIPYFEKKRFTAAHEIGHLLMHDKLDIHNENDVTLNWFSNAENQAKKGLQEFEANSFAAELLMPEKVFKQEAFEYYFSPELLAHLSSFFKTSLTSTIFRCFHLNVHPILIVFTVKGVVKYWLKSHDLRGWVLDVNRLPPHKNSVASDYINSNYDFIYKGKDKKQEIRRSTWFKLNENQEDDVFYEYCIPTKQYESTLSVIWQD
jgi:Zn-dependent peptidase ImmA (M78 family)